MKAIYWFLMTPCHQEANTPQAGQRASSRKNMVAWETSTWEGLDNLEDVEAGIEHTHDDRGHIQGQAIKA